MLISTSVGGRAHSITHSDEPRPKTTSQQAVIALIKNARKPLGIPTTSLNKSSELSIKYTIRTGAKIKLPTKLITEHPSPQPTSTGSETRIMANCVSVKLSRYVFMRVIIFFDLFILVWFPPSLKLWRAGETLVPSELVFLPRAH